MQLEYPQLAKLSCADCAKYYVTIPDGKILTHEQNGETVKTPRPKGVPTPCDQCPRQSPELEHLFVLSEENKQLVKARHRLVKGAQYGQKIRLSPQFQRDPFVADALHEIDEIYDEFDKVAQARAIANELIPFLIRR